MDYHLKATFESISNKAGLTVKPSKCQFGFRNMNFVGHTVGSGVLRPGESKVKAVQEASKPQTKRQVKSFLGLIGFFRKHVPNFASVAVPLTALTKKGLLPNRVFTTTCIQCSQTQFDNSPILHMPDLDK